MPMCRQVFQVPSETTNTNTVLILLTKLMQQIMLFTVAEKVSNIGVHVDAKWSQTFICHTYF
jgi:hypothetical protein